MCGIVGYVGRQQRAMDVLIDGLRRLEYRGYDSAGVAIFDDGDIVVRRALGKLANLEAVLRDRPLAGQLGLGHTRWATHGKPSERNAHPHRAGSVVVVHNGIVENHRDLRREIEASGGVVQSDTDTELIAHLVDAEVEAGADLLAAVRQATSRLVGSYALGVLCDREPGTLVAAKNGGSPIILGVGEKEAFLASDIPAILPYTRAMLFLEDGDFARLGERGIDVVDASGALLEREPQIIQWDPVAAEKGRYDRFMQKEIFEQPRALTDTIGTRVLEEEGDIDLDGIDLSAERVAGIERMHLVACGTAYHSCLVGKYMIEQLAGIPAEVDLASEFRYRQPILNGGSFVVPVSQSGETADTLAALREGRRRGARILSICNVREASIARESDDVLYTHAGPEIGVASTKAFTTQLVAFYLLAMKLAIARGRFTDDVVRERLHDLVRLPRMVEKTLQLDGLVREIAQPLPGAGHPVSDRPRGGAQAQGDLLHPRRGLRGRRDEARTDRPDRRGHAGGGDRPAGSRLRQGALEPRGGPSAGRPGHRARERGRRRDRREGQRGHPHPRSRGVPDRHPRHGAPAAPRLPRGGAEGHGRGSAPQPGEERDRRVTPTSVEGGPAFD
jgi:glucosamine--fructose-6-phosphate aminotransferase (isomerizing)